jgi:hypothetical protein
MDRIKTIYHVSDLHIKDGRRDEYSEILSAFYDEVSNDPDGAMIVCTGNVFDIKSRLSPENITDFCKFFRKLSELVPVIILPGINDFSRILKNDFISTLLEQSNIQNVTFCGKTAVYRIKNIFFYASCLIDSQTAKPLTEEINKDSVDNIPIGLTYGECSKNIDKTKMSFILGGGTKNYYVNDNIVYAGPLIQQSVNENPKKGFVKWDLTQKSHKFVEIKNKNGNFLKLIFRDNKLINDSLPDKVHDIIIEHENCTDAFISKMQDEYRTYYKHQIQRVIDVGNKTTNGDILDSIKKLYNKDSQMEMIYSCLLSTNTSKDIIDQVKLLHQKHCESESYFTQFGPKKVNKWKLRKLIFSDMFCFEEDNIIDFDKISGISGVIAGNRAGKSALLDILIFGLYNKLTRGDRSTMIRCGCKNYSLRLEISVEDPANGIVRDYVILRFMKQSSHKVTLYKGLENITGETLEGTYIKLRQIIGTYDDFVSLCASLQNSDEGNFLNINQAKRKDLMNRLFKLNVWNSVEITTKGVVRDIKAVLKSKELECPKKKLGDIEMEMEKSTTGNKRARKFQKRYEEKLKKLRNEKEALLPKCRNIERESKEEVLRLFSMYNNIPSVTNIDDLLKDEYNKLLPTDCSESITIEDLEEQSAKLKEEIDGVKVGIGVSPDEVKSAINDHEKFKETRMRRIVGYKSQISALQVKKELLSRMAFSPSCESCHDNEEILETKDINGRINGTECLCKKYEDMVDTRFSKVIADISDYKKIIKLEKKNSEYSHIMSDIEAKHQNKETKVEILKLQDAQKEQTKRDKLEIQIKELSKGLVFTPEENKLDKLNKKILALETKKDRIMEMLIAGAVHGESLKNEKIKRIEYNSIVKKLQNDLEIQKQYLFCLDHKKGIPHFLLGKITKVLENEMNVVLQRFTDFKVSVDREILIHIISDPITLPVCLASGFQQFIVSIVFKICLAKLAMVPVPDCLIIDEGFGCLDESNITNIQYLLGNTGLSFVFIISHIEALQSYIRDPIFITQKNYISKITNTMIAKNYLEMGQEKEPNIDPDFDFVDNGKVQCRVCGTRIARKSIITHKKSKTHVMNLKRAKLDRKNR